MSMTRIGDSFHIKNEGMIIPLDYCVFTWDLECCTYLKIQLRSDFKMMHSNGLFRTSDLNLKAFNITFFLLPKNLKQKKDESPC